MLHGSIVLIGPSCAGKSTISKLLGARLGWSVIELDEKRGAYRDEIGYDAKYAQLLRQEQGFEALAQYWKPYDIYCIERVIQDYPTAYVIAFGAGNSIYEVSNHFDRAKRVLTSIQHVILLEPSPEKEVCIHILEERLRQVLPNPTTGLLHTNRSLVGHPSNKKLATITFFNGDEPPAETTESILNYIQLKGDR